MKILIQILLLAGVLFTLGACKEDKVSVFEGTDNIFFRQKQYPSGNSGYTTTMVYDGKTLSLKTEGVINKILDSIEVSMSLLHVDQRKDTMFVPVRVIGNIAPVDRKINFRITHTDEPDAAVENENFRVLDAFIPANKRDGGIVVELNRDGLEELEDGKYKIIDFELLPNEYFGVNYPFVEYSTTDTTKVTTLHMRVLFTDGLATPPGWKAVENYCGTWSTKKASLLHYELGMSWEFMYSTQQPIGLLSAYGSVLKRWLNEYKAANGVPYYEADGVTEMTAGKYAV